MALVEHCGFDVTGLHVEQGMLWGCGTTEPKPRPTVATEVFFCHVDSPVPLWVVLKGWARI